MEFNIFMDPEQFDAQCWKQVQHEEQQVVQETLTHRTKEITEVLMKYSPARQTEAILKICSVFIADTTQSPSNTETTNSYVEAYGIFEELDSKETRTFLIFLKYFSLVAQECQLILLNECTNLMNRIDILETRIVPRIINKDFFNPEITNMLFQCLEPNLKNKLNELITPTTPPRAIILFHKTLYFFVNQLSPKLSTSCECVYFFVALLWICKMILIQPNPRCFLKETESIPLYDIFDALALVNIAIHPLPKKLARNLFILEFLILDQALWASNDSRLRESPKMLNILKFHAEFLLVLLHKILDIPHNPLDVSLPRLFKLFFQNTSLLAHTGFYNATAFIFFDLRTENLHPNAFKRVCFAVESIKPHSQSPRPSWSLYMDCKKPFQQFTDD